MLNFFNTEQSKNQVGIPRLQQVGLIHRNDTNVAIIDGALQEESPPVHPGEDLRCKEYACELPILKTWNI